MSYFKPRKVGKNYDLLSSCAWYVPDIGGLFSVLGWFLVGMILGGIVMVPFLLGGDVPIYYLMLIIYPVQFLPVFIYVRLKSMRNAMFERGYALDSNHFGSWGGGPLAFAVVVGTLALGMVLELVNHYLPDTDGSMVEFINKMLSDAPLWLNLVTMCIMAPVLEEWLCRGVILRGLLNYRHRTAIPGGERERGMSPALAIVISAIFFAAIHGNVWQGVSAFAAGALLGYVYYRTGSLKLTMLMHCANNTMSVLAGKFGDESVKEAKSLVDVFPAWEYAVIFVLSVAVVLVLLRYLRGIELQDPQGNCDLIPSAEDAAAEEK